MLSAPTPADPGPCRETEAQAVTVKDIEKKGGLEMGKIVGQITSVIISK
jgi:hypothetical protein